MHGDTHKITDEMLSAWLDSALDDAESRAVECALEDDPQLNRRLAQMMQNDRGIRRYYRDAAAARPVPKSIAGLLEPAPESADSGLSLIKRFRDWFPASSPLRLATAFALTAGIGVAVAVLVNDFATGPALSPESTMALAMPSANPELQRFLDSQPSGRTVAIGDQLDGVVDLSFEHVEGGICRQYRVGLPEGSQGFAVIACRNGDGWQEVLAQRINASVVGTDMFRAAGGQAASAIDRYIVDNMVGDIFVGDEEAEILNRDWRQR